MTLLTGALAVGAGAACESGGSCLNLANRLNSDDSLGADYCCWHCDSSIHKVSHNRIDSGGVSTCSHRSNGSTEHVSLYSARAVWRAADRPSV